MSDSSVKAVRDTLRKEKKESHDLMARDKSKRQKNKGERQRWGYRKCLAHQSLKNIAALSSIMMHKNSQDV